MSDVVSFYELEASNDKFIGIARLDKEKALNALSLDMVGPLFEQLNCWQQQEHIACVFLEGAGDKAFCAGGDVVSMHTAMTETPGQTPDYVKSFFTLEYRLDYLIRTFGKPLICWGNGIVMGGGLGLMSGASHRIVTQSTRIAMPEITIGLYPDVGATWFLNKMPPGCGMFLGLTGAQINATDALFVKLGDYFVLHELKGKFIELLVNTDWGNTLSLNHKKVADICMMLQSDSKPKLPVAQLKPHYQDIEKACQGESLEQVASNIFALDAQEWPWLKKAQDTLKHGSPISAHIVFQQLTRGGNLPLHECFQLELGISCQAAALGEFQEGVRALLVDKDKQPKWQYSSFAEVPNGLIENCFKPIWDKSNHPLADLGAGT